MFLILPNQDVMPLIILCIKISMNHFYTNYQRMWDLFDDLHAAKPDLFIDCTLKPWVTSTDRLCHAQTCRRQLAIQFWRAQ